MKAMIILIAILGGALFGGCGSDVQTTDVYEHPSLNVQFTASQGWEQLPRPEDADIYEVVDPQSKVHVVLWHTETEQSGRAYLMKMAIMKGLASHKECERRSIGSREAWTLDATGSE